MFADVLLYCLIAGLGVATARQAEDEGSCPAGAPCDLASVAGGPLQLPKVIVGCWQLLERHRDKTRAVQTLTAYVEAGFDTFDTADIYGPSEAILGDLRRNWVKAHPSASPLRFLTKYVTDSPAAAEADRVNRESLQSLGVEAADMVQFHWWSLAADGSARTFLQAGRQLTRLKAEGRIKHLAGCNMDAVNLKLLVDDGMDIEANQVQYSLLDRRPEVRLMPYCRERGIKLVVFGVVAGGILSDAFVGLSLKQAEAKLDSVSRRMYWSSLQRWSSDWALFQKLLRTLQDIGLKRQPQQTLAAIACAWALRQLDELGAGGALVLGVRDDRHLEEHRALLSGEVHLEPLEMAEIGAVLEAGNPPQGDIWHQERGWA